MIDKESSVSFVLLCVFFVGFVFVLVLRALERPSEQPVVLNTCPQNSICVFNNTNTRAYLMPVSTGDYRVEYYGFQP